jgi:ABC-type phosphate/phosphonate transport system substrate-binding protein
MYLYKLSIKCRLFHLFCVIMANLFLLPMLTNADTQVKRQVTVGYTEAEVLAGVNYKDAYDTAKFFFENPAVKQALEFDPQIIFSNLETMVKGINRGEIDLVAMSTVSYLQVKDQLNAEPFFVPVYDDKIENSYVLLVLKSKNISKIDQLRNKTFIIEKGLGGHFARLWADTLLFEKNLPESTVFFKTILSVDKASSAALPVFFGQSDACIIRKNSYELLAELNPQINEKLKILHESEPILIVVLLMRKDLSVDLKKMVIKSSQDLHKLHGSKQLMVMFHTAQLLPYKPEYLKNIENLYKKYQAGKKDHNEANTQIHLDTP